MSQNQVSIDGGRETIVTNSTPISGGFLSNQFIEVNNLTPTPTEWVKGKRPIYDRLPAASERYKVDFSLDDSSAYPYIPYGEGYTGTTSMAVLASGENKFLVIQGGNIVWKYGMIKTDPVILDIELVGMGSAKYLLAYQLYYDDSPKPYQYEVSNMSLGGIKMEVKSSTDVVLGWRYSSKYAFLSESERFWSNRDGLFPSYASDAYLSWQFVMPCSLSSITLRCPYGSGHTGTATIYYMSCADNTESEFCNNPVWNFWGTSTISSDQVGQFFNFTFDTPINCKGWKVEWSDPNISISDVVVSGIISEMRKPATMTTDYALVAYPANSVPSNFTNSEGKEVPLILCKLAYVDINNAFTVTGIRDIREVVQTKYEPIAEWLTRPWDENLMEMYDELSNFPDRWLNPDTCVLREYDKLTQYNIEVAKETCPESNYSSI